MQQATIGISGPHIDAIRQRQGSRRFNLSPAWKHAGTEYRNLINPIFDQGRTSGYFTLRGNLGPYVVVVTVTGYRSNGPESSGTAVVELASVVDARPTVHALAPAMTVLSASTSLE